MDFFYELVYQSWHPHLNGLSEKDLGKTERG
jgi:hypothetical protein